MSELKSGALLQGGKYKIEKVLGQGGFGITYLAEQTLLDRKVCIKEFFIKEYGERTASTDSDSDETIPTSVIGITAGAAEILGRYREKFVKEARMIAKLDHPRIVRIHDVFEENDTAYYVMDFIEGENLSEMVRREGALPEARALGYIRQVADALSYVHGRNIMHLDVKPSNILVRKSDDTAILIDFGTAKQYDSEGAQTSTNPVALSAGYAPIEVMKPGGVQTFSPESDVYSLGATLYYLVTGQNPPDASERMEMLLEGETFSFADNISSATIGVIEQSMQGRKKRFQNVNEFLKRLFPEKETVREDVDAEIQESLRIEQERLAAEWKRLAEERAAMEQAREKFKEESQRGHYTVEQETEQETTAEEATGWETGYMWVDLGLSVKWAAYNVGASRPEQVGNYFAFGETWPKAVYTKLNYNKSNNADVAKVLWGGHWRMPTQSEFDELLKNCSLEVGSFGMKVTSKVNGKGIYLPFGGYHPGLSLRNRNDSGYYWSSSPSESAPDCAWCLKFNKKEATTDVHIDFYNGVLVRPVCD